MSKKAFSLFEREFKTKKSSKKALTLIEIIISLVLIALTLVGLSALFVAGKRHILHSRAKMSAGELCKVFLNPLHIDVRQDQWGANCLSSNPTSGCPVSQTLNGITYTPTYKIAYVQGTTLRYVWLTVSWTEPPP